MHKKFLALATVFSLVSFWVATEHVLAAGSYDDCWIQWSTPDPGGTLPPDTDTSAIAFFWNDTMGMQGGVQKGFVTGDSGGLQREMFDPPAVVQGQPWNCRPNEVSACDQVGFKYCLLWNIGPENNNSCSINPNPASGPAPLSGTIFWGTTGSLSSCNASGGWSGNKSVSGGFESYGPVLFASSYLLDCAGVDGSYYDTNCSGQVTISATPTPASSPPVVSGVIVTEPDYCASGPAVAVTWSYNDPDGDSQAVYQVQIDDSPSFTSPVWDSGQVAQTIPSGSAGSHNTASFGNCNASNPSGTGAGTCRLNWNIGGPAYQARVRVWDSSNNLSVWQNQVGCNGPGCQGGESKWKTPRHAYPQVNFSWSPLSPNAGQSMQFNDATFFSDSGGVHVWLWDFGDGTSNSNQRNPIHNFIMQGIKNVTLMATDSDSYSCSLSKPVVVQEKIPWWKEISPK